MTTTSLEFDPGKLVAELRADNTAFRQALDAVVLERRKADESRAEARRGQVGSGDRSQRIRTYNFPQGRVTDHRFALTMHRLPDILEGDLGDLITAVGANFQAEALKAHDS